MKKIDIIENLSCNINMNTKLKYIDDESSGLDYLDYAVYAQLKYKF